MVDQSTKTLPGVIEIDSNIVLVTSACFNVILLSCIIISVDNNIINHKLIILFLS